MERFAFITPTPSLAPFWQPVVDELRNLSVTVEVITHARKHLGLPAAGRFYDRKLESRTYGVPSAKLMRRINRKVYDYLVVIEYGPQTAFYAMIARFRGVPLFIFQENASSALGGLSLSRFLYRRFVLRLATGVIANTTAAEEELCGRFRLPPTRVHGATVLVPPLAEHFTESFRLPSLPRPIVLYVGQLIPLKNVEKLLEAIIALQPELEFGAVIVGDGPERETLECMAERATHPDRLVFVGHLPYQKLGSIYAQSDVFVMPTRGDYRNVAVLEAMRFGLAVIVSRHDGNVLSTIRKDVNAVVVEPTANELRSALSALIKDDQRRRRLGEAAQQTLAAHTPEVAAKALLRIARGAIGSKREN